MNEVKLLLKLEHIPEGNKWREFAKKSELIPYVKTRLDRINNLLG